MNTYRYPSKGASIQTIINKIYKNIESDLFPKNFSFHWLRASFALNYYNSLIPLVENKEITYLQQLIIIKNAMNHESIETTENYLKLFSGKNELAELQTSWENKLFRL